MPTVSLSSPSILQFLNNSGQPNAGGTLLTQVGGVNVATYQDAAGTISLPNPIPLNARGEVSNSAGVSCQLFLVQGSTYTFTLFDPIGNQINQAASVIGPNNLSLITNLAASSGSSLLGYTQGGTGAVASTVQNKLRENVSVKDFGAKGDGSTDDLTAINSAITYAVSNGKRLFFPAGTYLSSGAITATSGLSVYIQGESVGATRIVFTNTTGGFSFNISSQSSGIPPNQLYFDGMTIETRAAVSSPALSATWTAYQANAQGQTWIGNINIVRKADGTGSFTNGIQLNKCVVAMIAKVVILGDDNRVSLIGINLIDCVGIRIAQFDINRYATGVSITKAVATQSEGVYLTDGFVYDVFKGLLVNTAIHIEISNVHFNINGASATSAIDLTTVSQSSIGNGCLIYCGGIVTDAANQDGIQMLGCNGVAIVGNNFSGPTIANTRYGISLTTSSYNTIGLNNISNIKTGISISSGTSNNIVSNLLFNNTTMPIADNGTTTFRSANSNAGVSLDSLRWGPAYGSFQTGEISTSANWGGFIRGYSGTTADVALVDSGNIVGISVKSGSARVAVYAKVSLPAVASGGIITVSDDIGGYTVAFSDGANWRRVSDRAIIA